MTALGCILFGMEGRFQLPGGLHCIYENQTQSDYFTGKAYSTPMAWALRFRPLQIAALGYLHVTIHELGHALVAKAGGATSVHITVATASCEGSTSSTSSPTGRKFSFICSLAGPMAGTMFRVGLIALTTLMVGSVPAYILIATKIFSIAWMTGEMAYFVAGSTIGGGDWKSIADQGLLPWAIGATAITATYIAGIILAI